MLRDRLLRFETLENRLLLAADMSVRFEVTNLDVPDQPLHVGDNFLLQVHIRDLQNPGSGIFQAYFDVLYDNSLVVADEEIVHGDEYNLFASGTVYQSFGVIEEVGGVDTNQVPPGNVNAELLLFQVEFVAVAAGTFDFTANLAEASLHRVEFFDGSTPSIGDIQFLGEPVEIVAGGVEITPTSLTTTEAGGNDTTTIVLTRQPTGPVTIPISSSDTGEGTVTPASVTFTSENWSTAQTVTITGVNDDVVDGDIVYAIITGSAVSSDPSYHGLEVDDIPVVNLDDDTGLAISIFSADKSEGNENTAPFTFTVTRTGVISGATTVEYTVSGSGFNAANADDFGGVLPHGQVNFAPTETSKTITVNVNGDSVFELDETFAVKLSSPTGGAILLSSSATGIIRNDDVALVIAATDTNKAEGDDADTPHVFTVTRLGPAGGTTTVEYAVSGSGGQAAHAIDFGGSLPSGTLSFAAGQTSRTITINVSGDHTVEPDESFAVTLANATSGTQITTAAAQGTIQNDDTDVAIIVDDAAKAEGNAGETAFTFTVTRTGYTAGIATVDYDVIGIGVNPVDALDFDGTLPSGTITFEAGQISKALTVEVRGDLTVEDDETFDVTLSNASDGANIEVAKASGTIVNDDATKLRIAAMADGAESGPTGGAFTVALGVASSSDTTVDYTVGGTAISGMDYSELSGSVAIPAGDTAAMIVVPVLNDDLVEGSESVTVALSTIVDGNPQISIDAAADDATIQITDNDSAKVRIDRTANGDESGPADGVFTLTQNAASSTDTVISYTVSGVAVSGDDYTPLPASVTIPAGHTTATIIVSPIDDASIEEDETVVVHLDSVIDGDAQISIDSSADEASLTIADNDGARVSVSPEINADEAGPVDGVFTVAISGVSSTDTVISYSVDGTADSGSDFPPLGGSVTIVAGARSATIVVPVLNDALIEGTETVTVTLDEVTAGDEAILIDLDENQATIEIADNDHGQVRVGVATDASELGTVPGELTVLLSQPSSTDTVVAYTVGGSAISGGDYLSLGGTVTITAGNTSAAITVLPTDDLLVEESENVVLTLTGITAGAAAISVDTSNAEGAIRIDDDDTAELTILATDHGDELGPVDGVFTVVQSAAASTDTVIAYSIGGTAASGADFAPLSGTVTIPAGLSSATIVVAVHDDSLIEGDETVTAHLDAVTNGNPQVSIDTDRDEAMILIADDDTAYVAITATADGDEFGLVRGIFTVSQNALSSSDTVVNYSVSGTATSVLDYAALSGTVTIAAGRDTATIEVPVNDDLELEGSESVTITLDSVTGGAGRVEVDPVAGQATLHILDDEVPRIGIATTAHGAESPLADGRFTISQSLPGAVDSVVSYTVSGTAESGVDFNLLSGTATIPAGQSAATISVEVIDDSLVELAETVTLTLDGVIAGDPHLSIDAANDRATIEIVDDDTAVASITASTGGAESGPVDGTFRVTLTAISSTATVLHYTVSGTAQADTDYAALPESVTIPAGEFETQIIVSVFDDRVVEETELLTLTLTEVAGGSSGISIGAASQDTLELADDDSALVAISAPADTSESVATGASFVISLDNVSSTPTVIAYTVSGSADSVLDYLPPSGTVTIPAGETGATIDVTPIDDRLVEANETVRIALTAVTSGNPNITISPGASEATFSIIDDDTATVGVASTADGDEVGPTGGQFTIAQSEISSTDTVINFSVAGTATADSDYVSLSGTVTIAAGETIAVIGVPVINDSDIEGVETVSIILTSLASADADITIDSEHDQGEIHIVDDDEAQVGIEAAAEATEAGPSNGLFTVSLTKASTIDTTVIYAVSGTAQPDGDYAALSGTVAILAGTTTAQIQVPVIDDETVEFTETVTVTLTAFSGDAPGISIGPANEATIGLEDNDSAVVTVSAVNDGNESGSPVAQFNVIQSAVSSTDTTVFYSLSGSATSGIDYSPLSGSVTIPAGSTTAGMLVAAIDDNLVEPDKTITVTLTGIDGNPDIGLPSPPSEATVLLTDDDMALVSIEGTANGEELGTIAGRFTVTQSQRSETDTVISYSFGGTATAGSDYSPPSGTVTISAGETSATIDLPVVDDPDVEGTETVSLVLTGLTSADADITIDAEKAQDEILILDDDAVQVSVDWASDGWEDGPVSGSFTVSLTRPSTTDTVVNYTLSGTATVESDYETMSGSVMIPAGSTTETIAVPTIDDGVVEGDETVIVTLTSVNGQEADVSIDLTKDEATLNLIDNDMAEVSIQTTIGGAEEGPAAGRFTVTQNAVSATDTVIGYTVAGTALVNSDFTPLSGTVTIQAGSNTTAINVIVIDDLVVEADETVIVTLTEVISGQAAVSLSDQDTAATLVVLDNDIAKVSITDTRDGDEFGPIGGQFTITLSAVSSTETVVQYSVAGTATQGTDYQTLDGIVTIAAGSTTAMIEVPVLDDALGERTETVTVTLTALAASDEDIVIDTLNNHAELEIHDDDQIELSIIATAGGDEAGPSDATFSVALSGPSATDTVIAYTTGGSALAGDDYTSLGQSLTIPAGQTTATLTVPVIDDSLVEAVETVTITLTSVSSDGVTVTIDAANGQATANLIDDDAAVVSIQATQDGAESGPAGGRFTITQTSLSSTDTVISYTVSGSATSGTDFVAVSGTVTIAAGSNSATVPVSVIDDAVVEGRETVTVTLTGKSSGDDDISLHPTDTVDTLDIDDDDTASISFAAASSLVFEQDGSHSVAVVLDVAGGGSLGEAVTVTVSIAGGTAQSPADFTLDTTTITFEAGSADGEVRSVGLTIIADDVVEETDESVNLALAIAGDGIDNQVTLGTTDEHQVLISDDSRDASISGFVWLDMNGDGERDDDGTEAGIPGVLVTLRGTSRMGESLELVALTGADGEYRFIDLPSGTYEIIEDHSAAFIDGTEQVGAVGGQIDDDHLKEIELSPRMVAAGYNFYEKGWESSYVSIRLLLASTPPAELVCREWNARAAEMNGDDELAQAIRTQSIPSVVSADTSSGATAGDSTENPSEAGEGEGIDVRSAPIAEGEAPLQIITEMEQGEPGQSPSHNDPSGRLATDLAVRLATVPGEGEAYGLQPPVLSRSVWTQDADVNLPTGSVSLISADMESVITALADARTKVPAQGSTCRDIALAPQKNVIEASGPEADIALETENDWLDRLAVRRDSPFGERP